jgi:hypothetical protein
MFFFHSNQIMHANKKTKPTGRDLYFSFLCTYVLLRVIWQFVSLSNLSSWFRVVNTFLAFKCRRYVWQRALASRSCDSRHMHGKSTVGELQHADPLGKLVLLRGPASYMIVCGQSKRRNLFSDSVIVLHKNAQPHKAQQTRHFVQNLVGKHWNICRTFRNWHLPIFINLPRLEGALVRKFFHLRWRS